MTTTIDTTMEKLWESRPQPEGEIHTAAARYVEITRSQFWQWLESLGLIWEAVDKTSGIFLLHLSDNVGIKLSTSLTWDGTVMGVGNASMKMAMVSRVDGKVLNRKATGRSYIQRTKNWRSNLEDGIKNLRAAYTKSRNYYEKMAVVNPREYNQKWTSATEQALLVADLDSRDRNKLLDCLGRLKRNKRSLLWDSEESMIEQVIQGQSEPEPAPAKDPSRGSGPASVSTLREKFREDEEYERPQTWTDPAPNPDTPSDLDTLRRLWVVVSREGDDRAANFIRSVGEFFKRRGFISPRQMEAINRIMHQYNFSI